MTYNSPAYCILYTRQVFSSVQPVFQIAYIRKQYLTRPCQTEHSLQKVGFPVVFQYFPARFQFSSLPADCAYAVVFSHQSENLVSSEMNTAYIRKHFAESEVAIFFAFLSMIIRSILTTSVSKETINVKNANIIMITSYIVTWHHLRSLIIEACEGLHPFVMMTKDNHLPYTDVPCLYYIIEIYWTG